MYANIQLDNLLPLVVGITKKEIARRLDENSPLFNFSAEKGLTSYRNYTRNELLEICLKNAIDPVSTYHKMRANFAWREKYANLTGTIL